MCSGDSSVDQSLIEINNCIVLFFSVRSVMHKHLTKMGEVTFDKIFGQKLGELKIQHTQLVCGSV